MSTKTTMKANKKVLQPIIPSHSLRPQHRLALPQYVDEVPTSTDRSLHDVLAEPGFGHDFSQLQVHPDQAQSSQATQQAPDWCPLGLTTPTACPFGGACHTCPVPVQAKLTVGQPNDRYEHEADRVAEQVMRIDASTRAFTEPRFGHDFSQVLVHDVVPDTDRTAEWDQTQIPGAMRSGYDPAGRAVQLQSACGGTSPKYMSHIPQRLPRTSDLPEIAGSSGTPLPEEVRARAEAVFHTAFGNVQVHTDPNAAHAAARLAARAFTVGSHIYFGDGRYHPDTPTGLQLIGHEFAHVVQQRRGLSEAILHGIGDRYEQEAEAVGRAFARGESAQITSATGSYSGPQRSEDPGADAEQGAIDDSPYGLPFLGEANTPEELITLIRELSAEEGGQPLGLVEEELAMSGGPTEAALAAGASAAREEPMQTSSLGEPIQLAIVAGCNVPGVLANVIGIAAHGQIEGDCMAGTLGCQGEFTIPNDGRADLVRERIPFRPEIGEIKPASWLGRNLTALAEAQLAGYIAAYTAAFGGLSPIPMWSYTYGGAPFIMNPSQMLAAWGPSNGVYYYRCSGGRRRRVRRRIRVPVPVPVPVPAPSPAPAPAPSTGLTPGQVATGVAAGAAGVGIGYLIYRGIRMIPSLFPALWPTIPANLAIP